MGERKLKVLSNRRARGSLSRQEILDAAIAIVEEEGLDQLSMRHIARRLGCSVASPYTHFRSREEILNSLVVSAERELTKKIRSASIEEESVLDQLEAMAYVYWNFAQTHHELHRILFSLGKGPANKELFPVVPTSYRVFLETIRRGIQNGEIAYTAESYPALARTIWAWLYGLIVLEMSQDGPRREDIDPIGEGIYLFRVMLRRGENPLEQINVRFRKIQKGITDRWNA